ncbi:hypothetical protein RF55_24857 [Lasius niger]|uniref:Uncharacterized protein n=1 Tax=Lasius niger TaxID=67767 RepID=A0A0J7JUV5_LASNI|nr:hypothetical protein RF55_24857 [Lasius niger]
MHPILPSTKGRKRSSHSSTLWPNPASPSVNTTAVANPGTRPWAPTLPHRKPQASRHDPRLNNEAEARSSTWAAPEVPLPRNDDVDSMDDARDVAYNQESLSSARPKEASR